MGNSSRTRSILATLCAAVFCLINPAGAEGFRTTVGAGTDEIAVIVVKGAPYEMGYAFGELTKEWSTTFINRFLQMVQSEDPSRFNNDSLDKAWQSTSRYASDRFKDELRGVADGAGIPLETLQRAHMIPAVADYSCSSVAVWGSATKDGHLYQTRNLDWVLEARAHDFPCLVVYLPDQGIPHVNVTFAGYVGCNTGMNAQGIVLSEMGDSPASDWPFDLDGIHFTMLFRDILYDAHNLDEALDMLRRAKRIKKYHFVFGDGKTAKRAVKIKAHAPDLLIWYDNDPADEFAPNVAKECVYNDEGRGAFPHIMKDLGRHDSRTMTQICREIPIKGGNVLDVVYDATDLRLWVAYAEQASEAYKQTFVPVDLNQYLAYNPAAHAVVASVAGTKGLPNSVKNLAVLGLPVILIVGGIVWLRW